MSKKDSRFSTFEEKLAQYGDEFGYYSLKYNSINPIYNIELFDIDRSGIVRHINNIYKDEELSEDSTCAKIAHVGNDGKQTYNTKYYNLDMVISVGFRVNSKKAIKL